MTSFFENPILNSPYAEPSRHHALDETGQPLDLPPQPGRRPSKLLTPVPPSRKKKARGKQAELSLGDAEGFSEDGQEYNPTPIINEIRGHVASWRALKNPADWGVTPTTARLLQHWRSHDFQGPKPFFCQIEAVETAIWLAEVARREKRYQRYWDHLKGANEAANPDLLRIALKLATGAGKTTVMAMLIAWQAANAARTPGSPHYARGFLIVAPGITIRDRLRVLNPADENSYYASREIVPPDMLPDIAKAKIVITNYHAFQRRKTLDISKVGSALLKGRTGEPIETTESVGEMLHRVCGDLLALKNVVVLNDEAHHCYREKPRSEEDLTAEDKEEAKQNNEAARLWISGLEALARKGKLRAVYDLSATPFFLRGSGYREGTLFPWVVSDFSLMDAIECGIVKLPRVPVADNATGGDTPTFRDLWVHIGKELPKKGAGKAGDLDPLKLPNKLLTALNLLYSHYEKTFRLWDGVIETPPVFIVVCQNTAISKLVYEWISGWDRPNEDGELLNVHQGHLELFRNYDQYGQRLARPRTLLIDSMQLESGEALDPAFREIAGPEIEAFKREKAVREGAGAVSDTLSDADLLREVMNTVGKPGRLGADIRCVVSVSMLTEGWDANTVTHILGVRAFGTQLLCEQVVGRALRRQSYALNDQGLFDAEYADIFGIPFDFTGKQVVAPPTPPKPTTRVQAMRERERLEILYPRVEGYRRDLPAERLKATFSEDSRLPLTPEEVGPCTVLMAGIVGENVEITPTVLEAVRPSTIVFHLAKRFVETKLTEPGADTPYHLFNDAKRIVGRWLDEGYLVTKGGVPRAAVMYLELADKACELIYLACQRSAPGESRIKAVPDPYNPRGSSRFVGFTTSKADLWKTDPEKSHINYVVCDSEWEAELARVLEAHPRVIAYVKNQGLGFEVPYRDGGVVRRYVPDFIVRIDLGDGEELNLVVETKGYRGIDAQLKAETMKTLWVPGVNNVGLWGRWDFAEFRDVYEIEAAFGRLVDEQLALHARKTETEPA
ncbi:BPTD_3080 family restriction endonuclease [Salinarimonas rosea]|uniref:BPTD_3080 family restriction endonuclease n=1 Tax=Salinarimonas rosea TaxID=552063 RepID=UPI0003F85C39|nr:DEAD/DEAH box helicase family protein [Salinarimonas rosea]